MVGLERKRIAKFDCNNFRKASVERLLGLKSNVFVGETMFDVMAGWVDDPDLRLDHAAPTVLLTVPFPISVLATSTPWDTLSLSCLKTILVRNPHADLFRQVHAWWEILQQGQHVV